MLVYNANLNIILKLLTITIEKNEIHKNQPF